MILRRSSRTDPRLVLGTALAFALPLGANPAALAQTPPAKAPVQAPVAPGPVPYLAPQPAPPGSPILRASNRPLNTTAGTDSRNE